MMMRMTRPAVDRRRALIRIAAAVLAAGLTAGCAAAGAPPSPAALQLTADRPGSGPQVVADDDDGGLLTLLDLADCIRLNGLPEYPLPDPVTGELGLTDAQAAQLKQDPRLAVAMLLCIDVGAGGGTIGG